MIIALLIIVALSNLLVAFFLFAIWRAIFGKSSVDLKLATSITSQTKKMETLTKGLGEYGNTQDALKDVMKDMVSLIRNMRNEKNT